MSTSTTQPDGADGQSATPSDNGYSQTSPKSQSNFSRREVLAGIGVVGSAILAGCGAQKVDDESKSPPVVPSDAWYDESVTGDVSFLEEEITRFTNSVRKKHGAEILVQNPDLSQIARYHSWDQNERGYYSHVTPEGKTPKDRVDEAGLEVNTVTENLVKACHGFAPGKETKYAKISVNSWLGSPSHRKALLNPKYTHTGVGVYVGADGCGVMTQLFAQDYMGKL